MKRRQFLQGSMVAAAVTLTPGLAAAQFKVDVAGVGATQIPVGIGRFVGQDNAPQPIADIVRADLARSSMFRCNDLGGTPLGDQTAPNYGAWSGLKLEAVAGGSIVPAGPNRWMLRLRLWDVVKQADLGGETYQVVTGDLRLAAHRIADFIYQKLTGQRGVFATRIAYVAKAGAHDFSLIVADSDGEGARVALRSREPLLSPTWSPDGNSLAYVSFETGKPVVFTQDIRSGARRAVANFRGSNSAPAYSPDGRQLAVVLTLGARSQVYLIPAGGGQARRITESGTIATEPTFTADGHSIYFVSDRDGSPQIYQIGIDGSGLRRVSYGSGYNVSPAISPDGRYLAYISRQGNNFQLWLLDMTSGSARALGDGPDDGRPTFAPNGQIVLYSAREGGAEVLKTVSVDGAVRSTLVTKGMQVREPAWGPWSAQP